MKIRPYDATDWPEVERIYAEGIATKVATFETQPKAQSKWEEDSIDASAIVAETSNDLLGGWAVLWPVSDRCAYAGVAEVSVYVGSNARGQGVGKALLNELVTTSEKLNIWTLQAGIFEENTASINLHEKCGFRLVGMRERLGALDGVWKNIVLMERRSKVVAS
ncbi:MAG: N-acetyltransferase [Kordiimonadaceae bacterium]|nr:N-acetyltransferase [Kordiimonadaceae bacterium]MBO6567232.1 N-acetyltransferase [Kordiimonadaceae bacterium]MBO6963554.1 N-acetyltransferase [Kordiimonadaceae bacterium]